MIKLKRYDIMMMINVRRTSYELAMTQMSSNEMMKDPIAHVQERTHNTFGCDFDCWHDTFFFYLKKGPNILQEFGLCCVVSCRVVSIVDKNGYSYGYACFSSISLNKKWLMIHVML